MVGSIEDVYKRQDIHPEIIFKPVGNHGNYPGNHPRIQIHGNYHIFIDPFPVRQFLLRNQIREHAAADHRDHRTEKGTGQGNKYGQQNPVVPEYFLVAFQGKIGGKDKEPSFRLLGICLLYTSRCV